MALSMNLRPRFLWLTSALFLTMGLMVWVLVRQISVDIIDQWSNHYAEKQVLYDKSRLLQPITREIALSRQMAESTVIQNWARDPDNERAWQAARLELESFRNNFADRNYFYALKETGAYYYNNAENEFADQPLRYYLSADDPNDRWFFMIVDSDQTVRLNVNPDFNLGVTKLWIDTLVRDGDDVLGVAGTGLELSTFLDSVIDSNEAGISTLFTDLDGAVQLHRQQDRIAYASAISTSEPSFSKSLKGLIDEQDDYAEVRRLMASLIDRPDDVLTTFIHVDGRRHIAGIAFIPEFQWFEITLMDLDTILPFSTFRGLLIGFGIILLLALVIMQLALSRFVLSPLAKLEEDMHVVRYGRMPNDSLIVKRNDEIGRLMQHFRSDAASAAGTKQSLEEAVMLRTVQLEELSRTDALTGLLNRRGINQRLEEAYSQLQREGKNFGLVWLDMDNFKQINDHVGHEAGDHALIAVADEIRKVLRPYDCASRWGGDEFMLMIQSFDGDLLGTIAQRLLAAVSAIPAPGNIPLTISISTCVIQKDESLQAALRRADAAMYEAKQAGRNCHRAALDPESPEK